MSRIRKSKANTKLFQVIPKVDELEDAELMKRKYKGKRVLGKKDEQRKSR